MRYWLLEILVCPNCKTRFQAEVRKSSDDGMEILQGTLSCGLCRQSWPVYNGVPRFVPSEEGYYDNFGWQWDRFRRTQIDGFTGLDHSRRRFLSETGWEKDWLSGRLLLDAGCGAGRFVDIAVSLGARVVAVDISAAVDSCRKNLLNLGHSSQNFEVLQASLYHLPFRAGSFQGVYSLGVIQHTPDRQAAVRALAEQVEPGGEIALWVYEWRWQSFVHYRFFFRWFTRYMPNGWNWLLTRALTEVFFPVGWVLSQIPRIGGLLVRVLPIAFRRPSNGPYRTAREWSTLDTFDNLSPRFDVPVRESNTRLTLQHSGFTSIIRGQVPGLALKARKI